ncbi:MAG: hypothetical protein ABJA98_10195 [Acidobacteriota bacterium]
MTITISPTIWQDEVQIVDLGRSVVAPDPTWSLNWTAKQRPVAFVNYLGPILQERAYRWLAPSNVGPRLSTLLGALVAGYFTFLWLRSRRVRIVPALVLAVTLFLDPIFVQGYRGGRVDCFVIALVMAACVVLRRRQITSVDSGGVSRCWAVLGGLLVVACFVWPSGIFLLPLVAAEGILVCAPLRVPKRTMLRWCLAFAAGGLISLALCLVPVWNQLPSLAADALVSKQANSDSGSPWTYFPASVLNLVLSYEQSPCLPIAAVAAAFNRRNRVLAISAAVATISILPTHVYVHRVVYLLPYLIGLIGEGWRVAAVSWLRSWGAAVMAIAVVWAGGISLVARPALALAARHARSPELLVEAAARLPELRFQRIYLEPWEFYYVGRQFGWRMVRPYGYIGSDAEAAMFADLDYALVNEGESTNRREFFAALGWHLIDQFTLPSAQAAFLSRVPTKPRRYELYSHWPHKVPTAIRPPP